MDHSGPRSRTKSAREVLAAFLPKASSCLGVTLLLGAVVGLGACRPQHKVTHVLLISIDSLRADHLGAYGYHKPTSPRIDALAREGTLFEQAISSTSWTLPAHAALFTGLADGLHGVVDDSVALAPEIPTLADRLRREGFATGAVISAPYLHPRYGLRRGFDQYLNCMGFLDDAFEPLPGPRINIHIDSHGDETGPCVVRRATEWLTRHRRGPAFLFAHFWDVHYDYRPPPGYAERFDPGYDGRLDASGYVFNTAISKDMSRRDLEHVIGLYDGEIAFTDERVGELLDAIDRLGLRATTLVVLVSDHGDAFFEHGRKGHRNDLHGEVLRIPLILRGPGVTAGASIRGPAHITDVPHTILDLLGLARSADVGPGTGISLRPAFSNPDALRDRWALAELYAPSKSISLENRRSKVMMDLVTGEILSYDLLRDEAETAPIPPPGRAVAELKARLEAIRQQGSRVRTSPLDRIDAELSERLRSLGYAQ